MTTGEILNTLETEEVLIRPAITVYETEKDFQVDAEMPGVKKEAIEVTLENDHLILSAKRPFLVPEKARVLHQETFSVAYYRDLVLGQDVLSDGVQASYENGILRIRLQKSEKATPRKIAVL